MYEDFYKLTRSPFNTTPDTHFFYLSPSHREAFAGVMYGIGKRKGIIELVGEVGTGKTTVLQSVLASDDLSNTKIVYIFNPALSYRNLVAKILVELSHTVPHRTHLAIEKLHRALLAEYQAGNNVVVVIDEAQNMPVKTLEQVRMLSNIETSTEKLMQIVLCGQPELDRKIGGHQLRQLKDRIAVKVNFQHLTEQESLGYIEHRLIKAGSSENLFSEAALDLIVAHCKGNPRRINILCDMSLMTGFGYDANPVTDDIVREVIEDFHPLNQSTELVVNDVESGIGNFFQRLFRRGFNQQL